MLHQAYILLMVALLDGDVLPLVIFPRHPEMMPIYLWNTMKVLIWRTRLLMCLRKRCSLGLGCWWNRQISESSPGSENSDVIHFRCQACSLKTLEVEEEKEINERHNSIGPVGSGSGVKWDSAWHFSAIAEQKCLVMHTEAGQWVYCVPGVPRRVSCRVAGVAHCKLGWVTDFILSLKNLFTVGCAGSLLLCAFSSCSKWGLLTSCGAWVSRYSGFSCCGAQALSTPDSVVAIRRLSSCGLPALECAGFSSCGLWA